MSDKGLLFKKRKNNHGSHRKCSSGSRFPRHDMDYYPGTHLGMKLRYQKKTTGRVYKEWSNNYGYIRTNRIEGLINKYLGKPYNDLVKEFYVLTKKLRDSHKEVGLKDLEWHFENIRYRRCRGDYYIDDEGLVQQVKSELNRKQSCVLNRQQISYNNKVKIPDFGRVALARELDRPKPRYDEAIGSDYVTYEKPQYSAPRLIGHYRCDIDGVPLFLPIYHVPESSSYAEYLFKTVGKKPDKYYYYSRYPTKWNNSKEFCDRFSDMYRPGTGFYRWAVGVENTWIVPIIPFRKRECYGLRSLMYKKLYHEKRVLLPNTKGLDKAKRHIECLRERLSDAEDPTSWYHDKIEGLKSQLEDAIRDLEKTPRMAYFNVGYGQLYPMVKKVDYEQALRAYEQKQKETNSEG